MFPSMGTTRSLWGSQFRADGEKFVVLSWNADDMMFHSAIEQFLGPKKLTSSSHTGNLPVESTRARGCCEVSCRGVGFKSGAAQHRLRNVSRPWIVGDGLVTRATVVSRLTSGTSVALRDRRPPDDGEDAIFPSRERVIFKTTPRHVPDKERSPTPKRRK